MTDGGRESAYDLLEWSGRDHAESSNVDLYRWHCSRSNCLGQVTVAVQRLLLGSVAHQVLHLCHKPVLVVRGEEGPG
jgi:hypothetical protein